MNNHPSNSGGSDNSVAFWVIGGVSAFAILLCWISACKKMERRSDAPNSSQTSQAAPATVNGGSAKKDGIDVAEPAVRVMEIAADIENGGGGGGGCCCGGGGCGDGGGCGGCGGD